MVDRREMLVLGAAALAAPTLGLAQQPQRIRLRGTLESVSDTQLVLRQRSGERLCVRVENLHVRKLHRAHGALPQFGPHGCAPQVGPHGALP